VTFVDSLISDESSLIASLGEAFSEGDFILCDEETAELQTVLEFRFIEVADGLLPARSGMRLFEGSCTVTVFEKGREVSVATIRSKVTCGGDPRAIHEKIAAFLAEEAVEKAGELIEPLVE